MGRTLKIAVGSIEEVQDAIANLDTRLDTLKLSRPENELLREQVLSLLHNALFRLSGRGEGLELHMKNVARAGSGTVKLSIDCPKRGFLRRVFDV